jgi:hypothetical protein
VLGDTILEPSHEDCQEFRVPLQTQYRSMCGRNLEEAWEGREGGCWGIPFWSQTTRTVDNSVSHCKPSIGARVGGIWERHGSEGRESAGGYHFGAKPRRQSIIPCPTANAV